jgi:poly-beta-1,6-N-acetyl-D-glucosamine synthase
MEILFGASAGLVAYVYFGYPLALALWARVHQVRQVRRVRPGAQGATGAGCDGCDATGAQPAVSIVIAVRNEAHRLSARIENLMSLDYSGERQIIVVSDGSTDHPDRALAGAPGNVELLSVPPRGKAEALNAGVARARHDVVVFADARQTFAPDALTQLVAPFADPRVGGVTGELVLDAELDAGARARGSSVSEGVGLYWRYEKALRRRESAVGSTLGATGAIYALRRALWQPLPAETLLDDVLAPMRAVLDGYRVVFEDRAKAFDRAASDARAESRRKIRTLAGNVQILWLEPRLLIPFVNPVWLQYMSHKVGRLVVPYALVALLLSSAWLAREHWIYAAALVAQCGFYLLAAYGAWLVEATPTAQMGTGLDPARSMTAGRRSGG